MGRAPCCDKAAVKRGPWSPEEDARLRSFIEQHGTGGNWIALPRKIGLKRCGKSCRLRWLNYLRPDIRHGGFSEEEDRIVCSLYIAIGSRWSIIAAQLPGRTDNDIKNYWNTRLKKKLFGGHPQSALTRHDHHRHASALMPLPAPLTSQTPCSSSSATTNVHVGGGLDMAATTVTGRSDTYVTMSGELALHAPVADPWWGDGGAFRTELDEIFRSGAAGSAPSAGGPGGALYTESAVSAGSTVTSASESMDWYQLDVQRYLGIP